MEMLSISKCLVSSDAIWDVVYKPTVHYLTQFHSDSGLTPYSCRSQCFWFLPERKQKIYTFAIQLDPTEDQDLHYYQKYQEKQMQMKHGKLSLTAT